MIDLQGRNILAVVAHPDDEALGCGGVLALNAAAGGTSTVLVVTEGSATQNSNDMEAMRKRHHQLEASCEILGINQVHHWGYPDMRLDEVSHLGLNGELHRFIHEGGFECVLTHHPYDVNRDHQVLFRSVQVACRPQPNCPVTALLTFHVNSATEWGVASFAERFQPNVYVDVSGVLETKLRALAVYEEELRAYPHPRSIEAVRDRCRVFGSEVGLEAAEALHLIYMRGGI